MGRKRFGVYMMASYRGVLYIRMTNNLERHVDEQKRKAVPGFTSRYNVTKLVHFEEAATFEAAAMREKHLKNWPRARKAALIEESNPYWEDLAREWYQDLSTPDPVPTAQGDEKRA